MDWASGVAPKPDPRTISKHVQRMVDVSASFSKLLAYTSACVHFSSLLLQLKHTDIIITIVLSSRLLQSVFKNYDLNQNGFISHDDFEKIAASFPFSFCVMDKEKWVFDRLHPLFVWFISLRRGEEAKVVFVDEHSNRKRKIDAEGTNKPPYK